MNGGDRSVVAIIPARFDSSRFPGKALACIAGRPMIAHVVDRVRRAGRIADVYVATDDERIADAARDAGAQTLMTQSSHTSGTDRVAEAAAAIVDAELIVNVQGDQPLIDPAALDRLAAVLADEGAEVATLATGIRSDADWRRPDVVKVVVSANGAALYFSRAPVPHWQAGAGARPAVAQKHIGVYAFRRATLLAYASWPPSPLERLEGLEQLRLLERGVPIRIVESTMNDVSVDRPEDIAAVEAILSEPTTT